MGIEDKTAGRFAYDGLERVIHEKARLGILSSLATHGEGLLFNDLKELCALTDGNLSRHLQLLQEAGLVEVFKSTKKTLVRMTAKGRARFLEYIEELERVVADARATGAIEAEDGVKATAETRSHEDAKDHEEDGYGTADERR